MAAQRLQDIIVGLKKLEQQALGSSSLNITNIINEKEKLQNELESALDQIDKLKTLVAENTLYSLYTVQPVNEGEGEGDSVVDINNVQGTTVGANDNASNPAHNQNRTYTDMGRGRTANNVSIKSLNPRTKSKSQSRVPGLDFSNLKQVKDFKDWYSYSKKLEDAIRLLREKIRELEISNQNLGEKSSKH